MENDFLEQVYHAFVLFMHLLWQGLWPRILPNKMASGTQGQFRCVETWKSVGGREGGLVCWSHGCDKTPAFSKPPF